jgi:hypothetical protein
VETKVFLLAELNIQVDVGDMMKVNLLEEAMSHV